MDSSSKLDADFFENIIVYNILTNEEYTASVIDAIKPEYFKDVNIRRVVELVNTFFQKRNALPTLTELKAYLTTDDDKKSFKKVVEKISELDRKYNTDELIQNSETFFKEKAVYNTLLDVIDKCKDNKIDTSEILAKFEEACSVSLTQTIGHDYFSDVEKHISDLQTEDTYIPSQWEWLDRKLGGGFLESGRAIYIFAGRTNVGKSIFLGNIATNIAEQGKTVLLITLEMSEMVYSKRISSSLTKIPFSELHTRTDDLLGRVQEYRANHPDSRLLVKEFPPSSISPSQLNGYIKKVVQRGIHIDAIVIDYVNLLATSVGHNSYEKVKHITEQIRALSYTYNCPIITATQLNRSGITELNPGLETVSESMGLAATADCMMSIWQEEEDPQLGIIRLGMMKNRFGPNFGAMAMRVDYSTLSLTEDEEINETEEFSEINQAITDLSDE